MRTVRRATVALLVAGCLGAVSAPATEPGVRQGTTAPDFTAKMVTGDTSTLKLSSLRGKYVLLVLMTEQCDACKQDLPTINDGNKRLAGDSFYVFAVVCNASRGDVRDLIKEHDITFPIAYDRGDKTLQRFGVRGVPTSFLIDPQGKVLSWSHGTAGQFTEVEELIGAGAAPDAGDDAVGQSEGPTPEALLREAAGYYSAGKLEKAYARCRQALEAEPDNVQARVLLGDIYRKAKRPGKAIEAYRGALGCIDPGDYARVAAAYNRIANTYIAAEKYAEAAGVYHKAIKTIYDVDHSVPFHAYLGMCYAKLGKRKEALAAFEKFLKLYKHVDVGVQKRHAALQKRVEAWQQQLKESAGD